MKVKSIFFGDNAKIALATLTLFGSTLLVSCYGDHIEPTPVPPAAKYLIVGSVVDAEDSKQLADAAVTISPTTNVSPTTATGSFQFVVTGITSSTDYTLTATKSGYLNTTYKVQVPKIEDGQVITIPANLAMTENTLTMAYQITEGPLPVAEADLHPDVINQAQPAGLPAKPFDVDVTYYQGALVPAVVSADFKVISGSITGYTDDQLKEYAKQCFTAEYGIYVSDGPDFDTYTQKQRLDPATTYYGWKVDYAWSTKMYTVTITSTPLEGTAQTAKVQLPLAYLLNAIIAPIYEIGAHQLPHHGGGSSPGGNP